MNLVSFTFKSIGFLIRLGIRVAIYGLCFVLLAWGLLNVSPSEQRTRATRNIQKLVGYTSAQTTALAKKSGINGSLLNTTLSPTQKVLNGEDPYADIDAQLYQNVDRNMDRKNAPSRQAEQAAGNAGSTSTY